MNFKEKFAVIGFLLMLALIVSVGVLIIAIQSENEPNPEINVEDVNKLISNRPLTTDEHIQIETEQYEYRDFNWFYRGIEDTPLKDDVKSLISSGSTDALNDLLFDSSNTAPLKSDISIVKAACSNGLWGVGVRNGRSVRDEHGRSMLWFAVMMRDLRGFQLLLEAGYTIDEDAPEFGTIRQMLQRYTMQHWIEIADGGKLSF
ncbi:MAG: hypothetical protein JNK57_17085 [Planctomycetaceae bacterium]|nr:hypothetical protein [Planctomycetaceae bacterium]